MGIGFVLLLGSLMLLSFFLPMFHRPHGKSQSSSGAGVLSTRGVFHSNACADGTPERGTGTNPLRAAGKSPFKPDLFPGGVE